jgi:hypothetical protein
VWSCDAPQLSEPDDLGGAHDGVLPGDGVPGDALVVVAAVVAVRVTVRAAEELAAAAAEPREPHPLPAAMAPVDRRRRPGRLGGGLRGARRGPVGGRGERRPDGGRGGRRPRLVEHRRRGRRRRGRRRRDGGGGGQEAVLAEVLGGRVAREAAAVGAERELRRVQLRRLLHLLVALRHEP